MKLIWGNELGGMGSQRGNAMHCLCWDYDIKSVYTFCSVLISLLLLFCSCPTPTSVIFGCILVTYYLSFCSCTCIFVMAPHTRQSKRIVTADNSQPTIAENQAWLDLNTQTVSTTTTITNTNLKGKLQLFLWSDLFDTWELGKKRTTAISNTTNPSHIQPFAKGFSAKRVCYKCAQWTFWWAMLMQPHRPTLWSSDATWASKWIRECDSK